MFEKLFGLKKNGTNIRTELDAGLATFMTMAYIIFVNPLILGDAGMDKAAVTAATCIAAAVGTLVMGFLANYPIALAPGMGLNAYFAYTAVPYIAKKIQVMGIAGEHEPWQIALAAVFVSGIVFLILTFLKVREMIVNGIPDSIKHATAVGIGLFIAFIGLKYAGIIVSNPATFVGLGSFTNVTTVIAVAGLLFTAILMSRRVKGAILLGILLTTLLGVIFAGVRVTSVFSAPAMGATFFTMDFAGLFKIGILDIIFVFLFVDMFDTIGTLIGVGEQGGFMKDGKLPRVNKALTADAVGTTFGAMTGTSTVTSYIESAAGVAEGGRTGLSSVFVGLFFLAALFFTPLVTAIPQYATAPALIIVGALMTKNVTKIKWDDMTEMIPAFLTLIAIPLTYSIANGIAIGFISYPLIKLFTGKGKEVSILVYILALLFVARYVFLSV